MRSCRRIPLILSLAALQFNVSTAWHSLRTIHHQGTFSRVPLSNRPLHSSPATTEKATPSASLRELFPPTPLTRNGVLVVDSVHTLSYQIYGTGPLNALFLHGGPGAGCFPNHARFFDSTKYQVVLLDQRGCGQSTPSGSLVNQTLQDLVNDCEALRKSLDLESWDVVLGGSWGTTVAMAYVQDFPYSIRSVILRGVCALRSQEVDWLFSDRPNRGNIPAWRAFCEAVDVDPDNMDYPRQALHGYYERFVLSTNDTKRQSAARAWMSWEFYNGVAYQIPPRTNLTDRNATMAALDTWKDRRPTTSPILVHSRGTWGYQTASGIRMIEVPSNLPLDGTEIQKRLRQGLAKDDPVASARDPWPFPDTPTTNSRLPIQPLLTCFYSTNAEMCLNYRNLVAGIFPSDIPCIAIQGGADGICPPDTALDVLERWPTMELRIPVYAGHSMYDPYITNELVQATDRMAQFLMDETRSSRIL
jgi:proline iminopeptidase